MFAYMFLYFLKLLNKKIKSSTLLLVYSKIFGFADNSKKDNDKHFIIVSAKCYIHICEIEWYIYLLFYIIFFIGYCVSGYLSTFFF